MGSRPCLGFFEKLVFLPCSDRAHVDRFSQLPVTQEAAGSSPVAPAKFSDRCCL